ncbi:HAD family hydrolase [Candidatus Gottesmanbacteria bacterium]|nr:HAD family hydrolase [Candidatus Gottesmanbacteria bacterium]
MSVRQNGFVNRFEKNESIWPILEKAKKRFRVGLLTNMYPGMLNLIKNHNLLPQINWNVIVDSSIEKTAKPDPKIFEIAQNKAGVSGKEILFIENSEGHVKAASDFGWQTFWYDSKNYQQSSRNLSIFFRKMC